MVYVQDSSISGRERFLVQSRPSDFQVGET